ncbi:hypothetical protein D3C71_1268760 [compost metagenome]
MADKFARVFGSFLRRIIDMGDGTFSERVVAVPPADMLSGDRLQVALDEPIDVSLPQALITGGGIAGISPRLRVDAGQTGFFAGRMFRSYINAVIPVAGPAVSFRFTSSKDFILWNQHLELTQGALQLEVFTGAVTPSGTWTQRPIIGVNRMSERPTPFYVPVITLESGGAFTGGTAVDLIQLRSSSANNSATNVGGEWTERGLPAGTYYGRFSTLTGGLTVNDAAQMLYSLTWEERP